MTQIISLTFVNLVTPLAWAKNEHLFNKLASGLWPLASGLWPLASGLWPLASGLWPLASGLLVINISLR
jgi:hypothetical protein